MDNWIKDGERKAPSTLTKRRKSLDVRRTARFHTLKILRLRASPHAVGAGVAAGVFAAFLPFVGIHIALSIAIAWLLGGNMIAAAASTALVGNPLTYPFIWAATWKAGELILHSRRGAAVSINLHDLFHHMSLADVWQPILKPMLIGSVPVALIFAAFGYFLSRQGAKIFRARRQARLPLR